MEPQGVKLLQNKKTRSLILHSETLKAYEEIYSFIANHEEISEDLINYHFSEENRNIITDLLPRLVERCHEEWKGDPEPVRILEGANRMPCALCGAQTKVIFLIRNILSGKRINVGSTCITLFTEEKLFGGKSRDDLMKKAQRDHRLILLNRHFPGINKKIEGWDEELKKYDVLIPASMEKPYREAGAQLKQRFQEFLDKKRDKSVLAEIAALIEQGALHAQEMARYNESNKHQKYVATRAVVRQLERHSDNAMIEELKKSGYITSITAPKIYEASFISQIQSDLNEALANVGARIIEANIEDKRFHIQPLPTKTIVITSPFQKFISYFGWSVFKEKQHVAITSANILRSGKLTDIRSVDALIKELDFALGKNEKVGLYVEDYGAMYDSYEYGEINLYDKRKELYITIGLDDFVEEFKFYWVKGEAWLHQEIVPFLDHFYLEGYKGKTLDELTEQHFNRIYGEYSKREK